MPRAGRAGGGTIRAWNSCRLGLCTFTQSSMPPPSDRHITALDRLIIAFDGAMRNATRTDDAAEDVGSPADDVADEVLDARERRHCAGLMRVNHAGEVAAQALYEGQSLTASDASTRAAMVQAAREEREHLRLVPNAARRAGLRAEPARPSVVRGVAGHRRRRRACRRPVEPRIRRRDRAPGGRTPRGSPRTASVGRSPKPRGAGADAGRRAAPCHRCPYRGRSGAASGRPACDAGDRQGHDPHRVLGLSLRSSRGRGEPT